MRVLFATTTLATLLAMAAAQAAAPENTNPYTVLELVDGSNFCTFMPPADSADRNIASTEYMGQVYCTGNTPQAKAAGQLADGFILSAHYSQTSNFVQVTGQIDPTKMNLNATDEGGQYDIAMPKQATCVGWKHFVNLIEPLGHTYCVRCCHSREDCNRGISAKGCAHIITGDYSGPYDPDFVPSPGASGSSGSGDAAPSSSGASGSSPSATGSSDSSVGTLSNSPPSSSSSPDASSDKGEAVHAQSVENSSAAIAGVPFNAGIALVAVAGVAMLF